MGKIWKNRWWWILPLGVLVAILIAVYVLGHMSSADSEMYPTTRNLIETSTHLS
mgnify:CR=1 FL=1